MRLHQLPLNTPSRILSIEWDRLDAAMSRRLQELGFDDGVGVEALHRGPFGGDPIACRIGRMTIALRAREAAAVLVEAA